MKKTLPEIAKELPPGSCFGAYRAYCDAKVAGIKPVTKACLSKLTRTLDAVSKQEQIPFAIALCELDYSHPLEPAIIPHPLKKQLEQLLEEWCACGNASQDLLRAKVQLTRELSDIDACLEIYPNDEVAVAEKVRSLIQDVGWQFHHIDSGGIIGSIEDVSVKLKSAKSYLDANPENPYLTESKKQFVHLSEIAQAWVRYDELEEPAVEFVEWARQEGVRLW